MYCGNAAPHIVLSRTTGDILILVANITTFGEEKRNWKWMWHNMKSEHNKLLTSTFRPFGNVQCDFDFVLMAHEKKKHPNKKSLEGKSMCFLRFCCHSSDNFEVRNHISGVIFGLWLCVCALLFFFFRCFLHPELLSTCSHRYTVCHFTLWLNDLKKLLQATKLCLYT